MAKTKAAQRGSEQGAFSKAQLLGSKRYRSRRDLLTAILEEKEMYTVPQTDQLINNFMKGVV